MYVARILYPVEVLGPGKRIGIWMVGCKHKCKGCSNPELWVQTPNYCISAEKFKELIQSICDNFPVDGFTISGGEPLNQPKELAELIHRLNTISSDILVYTGYQFEALQARQDLATDSVLAQIAVLIDGKYIEELNDGTFLRGSSNQRVYVLRDEHIAKYQKYLAEGHNQIQNFTTTDGVVSVGIHHKTF